MDIVGSIGYIGQEVTFLDAERFAYITGNSIYINNIGKGPRDMIWRVEGGLSCFSANYETQMIALAPKIPSQPLEVLGIQDPSKNFSLENPSGAAIINLSFSRDGEKLIAISDTVSHQLLVWKTGSKSKLMLSKVLASNCSNCSINPCDPLRFFLYGEDGLMIGTLNEVLGEYTVKLSSVRLPKIETQDDSAGETDSEDATDAPAHPITFALWLPSSLVLVGDISGAIYEVSMDLSSRFLGRFSYSQPSPQVNKVKVLIPTCAVLSVGSIVIGTSDGEVLWYPLAMDGAGKLAIDLYNPQQKTEVGTGSRRAVSSLAVDQNFLTLLIGTYSGEVHKISLDVNEMNLVAYDDVDHDGQPIDSEKTKRLENTPTEVLSNDAQNGVVLCSSFLTIDVQKFSSRARSSLSMFVTGSHSGCVKFWRHAAQTLEPMVTGGGIRRSSPKALSAITQVFVPSSQAGSPSPSSAPPPPPAICCIEFVALPLKHSRLVCVGLEDGCVQIWSVEAHENEDEDARDSAAEQDGRGNRAVSLVEDDEGGCLVRLEIQHLTHFRLYHCTLSLLRCLTLSPDSGGSVTSITQLVAASDFDECMHVITVVKNEQIQLMDGVIASLSLGAGNQPRALTFHEDVLYAFCHTGAIVGFKMSAQVAPGAVPAKKVFASGLPALTDASFSNGTSSAVILSNTNLMYTFPVRALNQEKGIVAQRSGFKSFEHSDVVIGVAHAPNGRYFATGTIGGSIYVWKIDPDDFEIYQANCVKVHAGPISSLTFSACSSVLFSCGVDGSSFVLGLDKPASSLSKMLPRSSALPDNGPQFLAELLPSSGQAGSRGQADAGPATTSTWTEQREAERAKAMKSQHRFKAMGITAAVGEIAQRLEVLVQQNAERSELEILDRGEFVIDVKRRDEVLAANHRQVDSARSWYVQKNYCNELRAARIRAKCWDPTEVKSTVLLPFALEEAKQKALQLSSFSIQQLPPDLQRNLARAKRLRAVEVRAQRGSADSGSVVRISGTQIYRSSWRTAVEGCPVSVSWISADGNRWPISDKVATLLASEKIDESVGGKDKDAGVGKDKTEGSATNENSTAAEAEDDELSVNSADDEHEIDEHHILNLLYPPQAVRTQVQKRTQIMFLKEVIRQIRLKFNDEFESLRREKEDIIGSIESRNTRMRAIQEDLRVSEQLFLPRMADEELRGTAVKVSPEELDAAPYESEAARQQRLREEEERRRRELEKDREDVKGRALEEMMHGTLEVKRDVFAEASALDKPDWMDILAVSDMTEGQLKEFDAYQLKVKAIQEEQANFRKSLEQEMKKLKTEVAELCKAFDEKLEELSSLKILVHREVLSHEIYIARLAYSMAKTEQTWKFLKKSEDEIRTLRADRTGLRASIDQLGAHLEDMKSQINSIQEEERQMDKTFRRDLQNLCNNSFDQDTLKVFTQLYRRRTYPRGGYDASAENFGDQSEVDISNSISQKNNRRSKDASSRGANKHGRSQSRRAGMGSSAADTKNRTKLKASRGVSAGGGGRDALGPMQQAAEALRASEESNNYQEKDPYYEALLLQEKEKLIQEAQIPILSPLSMELDCPEGFVVDQFSWSKLQELRNARIDKEIAGKKLTIEYGTLKGKLELLESEEVVLAGCIAEIKRSREHCMEDLRDLETNLDVVVRLRQGQDEVDKDAVVTDYSDALLLPINVLTKYNSRIKELGKEKIGILSKIKLFRRKINLIDWEAKYQGLEAKHYEAYLTDLQLFRVTRELQKVIRDGADANQSKERLDKVNQRRDFLNNDAERKLLALRKVKENLSRQLDDRGQECSSLEKKISALKSQVTLSKSVKLSRDEARGGGGDAQSLAASKMKKIISRRHMVDTARAQAEEIDYLRQELDKMRQRTFPSFVRATRKRLTVHPDGL